MCVCCSCHPILSRCSRRRIWPIRLTWSKCGLWYRNVRSFGCAGSTYHQVILLQLRSIRLWIGENRDEIDWLYYRALAVPIWAELSVVKFTSRTSDMIRPACAEDLEHALGLLRTPRFGACMGKGFWRWAWSRLCSDSVCHPHAYLHAVRQNREDHRQEVSRKVQSWSILDRMLRMLVLLVEAVPVWCERCSLECERLRANMYGCLLRSQMCFVWCCGSVVRRFHLAFLLLSLIQQRVHFWIRLRKLRQHVGQ